MGAVAAFASAGCVILGGYAETAFGRKDPSRCTLDEWAGQAVALCFVPLGSSGGQLLVVAGGAFLAFRFFDIVKPPPARAAQVLPAGWGILADDLVAGLYANLAVQLLFRTWLRW